MSQLYIYVTHDSSVTLKPQGSSGPEHFVANADTA
jgi:hypothetical protein